MKDLVLIQLHRKSMFDEFHDMFIDEVEECHYLEKLKAYGKKIN